MPRAKAFTCKRCGQRYTGARCPVCYASKKKARGHGSGGRARRSRVTAAAVLARDAWTVNEAALPQQGVHDDSEN